MPETTAARLVDFIEGHVAKDAKKYTDENRAYASLSNHESVNHSVGEYVRGIVHTNGLESFWSMMKEDTTACSTITRPNICAGM